MKICFVIGTLEYGGAEKIMRHLIAYFSQNNDTSVILIDRAESYDNLNYIVQYPILSLYKSSNRYWRTLKKQRVLKKIFKNNKFDVILSFGFVYNIDVICAALFTKTKTIICERNNPYFDPESKIQRIRRKIFYRYASYFVFQTTQIRDFFSKKISKRSVIIPNFIEYGKNKDKKYNPQKNSFATSARLDNRHKDQITLIRAFAKFLKNHQNYTLDFYGDGPDKELLINECKLLAINNFVIFHGKVSNPMEEIKYSRAFILTSKSEGMPNALIEAMSYGMPCISSRCSGGGAEALIQNGENGLLFDVGDVDELCNLMEKTTNDDFCNRMGNEAYKINDTLSFEVIIKKWEDLFNRAYKEKIK